jgi:hypothetical protein
MQPNPRQPIAERMRLLLMQQVGHAIDVERLQAEARYARDVLLVCDAFPGSELAQLARQFRTMGVTGRPRPPLAMPPAAPRGDASQEAPHSNRPGTTSPRRTDGVDRVPDTERRPGSHAAERIEPQLEPVSDALHTRPDSDDLGAKLGTATAPRASPRSATEAIRGRASAFGHPAAGSALGKTTAPNGKATAADAPDCPSPPRTARRSRFGITLFGPSQFLNSLFGATRFGRRDSPETAPPSQFDPDPQEVRPPPPATRRWLPWRAR